MPERDTGQTMDVPKPGNQPPVLFSYLWREYSCLISDRFDDKKITSELPEVILSGIIIQIRFDGHPQRFSDTRQFMFSCADPAHLSIHLRAD